MQDSQLVTIVKQGERVLAAFRHNAAAKRALGAALLAVAALLFVPPWFLIPGLVFTGLSLLGVRPFRFGACAFAPKAKER